MSRSLYWSFWTLCFFHHFNNLWKHCIFPIFVAIKVNEPNLFIVLPITILPIFLWIGIDSPVIIDSSISDSFLYYFSINWIFLPDEQQSNLQQQLQKLKFHFFPLALETFRSRKILVFGWRPINFLIASLALPSLKLQNIFLKE